MKSTNPKALCLMRAPSTTLRLFKVESGINGLRPHRYATGPLHLFRFALEQTSLRASNSYCILRLAAVPSFLAPALKRKNKPARLSN
jgi:hypothetical protein